MRLGALGAGGLSEASSLEQLLSMALVLADKPYQLISPSHRHRKYSGKWHPGAPLAACRLGKVQMVGDLGRHTYCVSPRDTLHRHRHNVALDRETHSSKIYGYTQMPTPQIHKHSLQYVSAHTWSYTQISRQLVYTLRLPSSSSVQRYNVTHPSLCC